MKILLIAKPWKGGLARYMYMALQDLFPGKIEWLSTYPRTLKERLEYTLNRETWKRGLTLKIKASCYSAAIFINYLSQFKELEYNPNHVLWLTDGPGLNIEELSPYGRIFLSDSSYEPELLRAINRERYAGELPFAHHPAIHRPVLCVSRQKDICFIGNKDSRRNQHISYLFRAGLRPTVVGNYFFHCPIAWRYPLLFRPAVTNKTMGMIYAKHRVSLNIHASVVHHGTNMRTFECAGYGIPQVVDYRSGIEAYFKPEEEILVYKELEEMPDQILRLLREPRLSKRLAKNASRRVLTDHTYYHRIITLLNGIVPTEELNEAATRVMNNHFNSSY